MSTLMVPVSRQQLEYWIERCKEGKAENVATMIKWRIEDYDNQLASQDNASDDSPAD